MYKSQQWLKHKYTQWSFFAWIATIHDQLDITVLLYFHVVFKFFTKFKADLLVLTTVLL